MYTVADLRFLERGEVTSGTRRALRGLKRSQKKHWTYW